MAEKITKEVVLEVFQEDELDATVQELIEHAKAAALRAYSPYSNFQVGAALLLKNGKIISGNNQENACYPAGLCAERVAFFAAKSQYPEEEISKIVIVAKRAKDDYFKVATPCGSCRQVMSEYENNQDTSIEIFLYGEEEKVYKSASVENLLPFKFSDEQL